MARFGFETTADEALTGHDLSGRTALVTGGTSGIGLETARALGAAGARVVITAREPAKAEEAIAIMRRASPSAEFEFAIVDLGSLRSVRDAAKDIVKRFPTINILINNAGVMATPFGHTADGFETQFGTNHLGHFLLTNLLAPALIAGAPARVVSLSSSAHQLGDIQWDDINFQTLPYDRIKAYAQAKTANMLFALALDRRLSPYGVRAFGVHPGGIQTNLQRHLTKEVMEELRAKAANKIAPQKSKTVQQGAASSVWAATSPDLDAQGGLYIQDCAMAPPSTAEVTGVKAYALDAAAAERLWKLSESMVGQSFTMG